MRSLVVALSTVARPIDSLRIEQWRRESRLTRARKHTRACTRTDNGRERNDLNHSRVVQIGNAVEGEIDAAVEVGDHHAVDGMRHGSHVLGL